MLNRQSGPRIRELIAAGKITQALADQLNQRQRNALERLAPSAGPLDILIVIAHPFNTFNNEKAIESLCPDR